MPLSEIRVDRRGFCYIGDIRLPMRYVAEARAVEFVVKGRGQKARHGNRVRVPLSELAALEVRRCESRRGE